MGTSGSRGRFAGCTEVESERHGESSNDAVSNGHRNVRRQPWLRSFGRRKGRKLSDSQAAQLASGLDRLKLDISVPFPHSKLVEIFPEAVDDVWLEIGFGAGEHLIWQAEHHPRVGVIGAEPYINGMVAALAAAKERGLEKRMRVYPEDTIPLLDWLPPASMARSFMLFPDPWPKKRHRGRRLLSPFFLDKLSRILCLGAEFRFASDIESYVEMAVAHAEAHPAFEIVHTYTSDERAAVPDWPQTRYERKAELEGRKSTFLILKRNASQPPQVQVDPTQLRNAPAPKVAPGHKID